MVSEPGSTTMASPSENTVATENTNPETINPEIANQGPNTSNTQPTFPSQQTIPAQYFVNPSTQILTIKLTDENYLMWKQQVLIAVRGYGLEGFLNRTIPCPPQTLSVHGAGFIPNLEYEIWSRQDQLLASGSWRLSASQC